MSNAQQTPPSSPPLTRKAYQKPRLEQVRLVPEEAVLSACKTADGGAASGAMTACINGPFVCSELIS
ncbi:MAG: hypothetical protein AB1894_04045 [Chloroflexota bacterium]